MYVCKCGYIVCIKYGYTQNPILMKQRRKFSVYFTVHIKLELCCIYYIVKLLYYKLLYYFYN